LGTPLTTANITNRPEEAEDSGLTSHQVITGDVDDGLLKNLIFDDGLRQEI
jgi:hypothetical protein